MEGGASVGGYRSRKRLKMKHRSILIFLLIILVFCSFLFASFYNQAKQEAIKRINNEQLLHARQAARGIEEFFNNWTHILTALSESNPIIKMDKTGKENMELLFRANQDKIRAITRVDAAGRIIYTFPFNRDAIGSNISQQDHIREIMRTHKPVVSNVFPAVQGYDAVALHVPVFKNKSYQGTIAVIINFQALAKRYLEDIKIGNTGYAWVISRDGTELYCPVPGHTGKSVFENCKDFSSILIMAEDMLKSHQGLAVYTFDKIRGEEIAIVKKHAVYMPINLGSNFWSIVVASSEDEIIASLEGFRNKLFVVIGLLLLGGVLFSYYGLKARFIIREEGKRRRTEAALRESESKLFNIIEFLPDATFVIDLEGKIIAWNRAIEEMTGVGKADMLGQGDHAYTVPFYGERRQHLLDLIDMDNQELAAKYNNIRRRGNTLYAEAFAHALYGGKGAYVFAAGTPLFDAQGKRVGAIESIRDITEKKEAERALRESEGKYRLLFENAGEGIMIVQEGIIRFANPAVMLILDYPESDIIGRYFLQFIHPQDRDLVIDRHQRRIQGETVETSYDFRIITSRGAEKWVHIEARLIFWEDTPATLNFFLDITTGKRAEEERIEMEQRLQQAQKLESIGTLAGGIAHDFNNLLMGIQGYASLMLLDLDPYHPHYERLRRIEEQVQSGADLTRQLLGFARGGRYEVKVTNLNDIISKTATMFGRTKKEIAIHQRLAADLRAAAMDRGQMEQVFLNLYVNAWQAMPGGGEIYVETENADFSVEQASRYGLATARCVQIRVTDTGIGMDTRTRERIFDPFFTTKEMGRGTGLGLAMVYGIIKGHGGVINVTSEPSRGTTFTIHLPATEEKVVKEEAASGELLRGTGTILLVDDEETVLAVSRELLESLGYRIYIAGNGQEAIAVYMEKKEEIELVILDMIMPGISGGETYDRLRAVNPEVRVLLASGYSIDGQAQEIIDRGCNGFLQKPFLLSTLSRKVREALTAKR
jgi:two-component system, cell cycle sensor histidine kinase and response regulator CckA